MTQEVGSEIIMRTENSNHTRGGDGRLYCKLASLLPVNYFSVVTVENTVGDHEEESLAGDISSIDFKYFDRCVQNAGKDEKPCTRQLVGAKNSAESNINRTPLRNRLKICNTSRNRTNRAEPYKLKSKNFHIDSKLKSSRNCTNDVEISREFKLDILTDVMQYIQNLQSLLHRDSEKLNNALDRDRHASSNLSENATPASSQPQTTIKKTVESSQPNTYLNPAPSEAESSSTSSTDSVKNEHDSSSQISISTTVSRREETSASISLELLEFKTGAITLTA